MSHVNVFAFQNLSQYYQSHTVVIVVLIIRSLGNGEREAIVSIVHVGQKFTEFNPPTLMRPKANLPRQPDSSSQWLQIF